jgi:hypothetical protein
LEKTTEKLLKRLSPAIEVWNLWSNVRIGARNTWWMWGNMKEQSESRVVLQVIILPAFTLELFLRSASLVAK